MAVTQRGAWLHSMPCSLVSQKRLAYKVRLAKRDWRCSCMREEQGEDDDSLSRNAERTRLKDALKSLDSYFDRLESKTKPELSTATVIQTPTDSKLEAEQAITKGDMQEVDLTVTNLQEVSSPDGAPKEQVKDEELLPFTYSQINKAIKSEERDGTCSWNDEALPLSYSQIHKAVKLDGSKQEQHPTLPEDEYALKEELLRTVLKEFEAAESSELTATAAPGKSTQSSTQRGIADEDAVPLLVLKSKDEKREDGEAKKETPLLLVRRGSLVVSTLVGINIGLYIFGLATSQQGESGVDLAFLQGAKINELILGGEWWRLLTSMFLHAGPLHLFLSSWAMISFGAQVESLYGTTGLLLIYLFGGVMGNLASFFETSQATVGGTGPVFAVICSWMVFLVKNRDTIKAYDTFELLQKVLVFSALSVLLGNQLPVDAWTHVGGALVGILFGVVASPWYQTIDASEINTNKTGMTLERLALVFLLCSGVLLCLYYYGLEDNLQALHLLY